MNTGEKKEVGGEGVRCRLSDTEAETVGEMDREREEKERERKRGRWTNTWRQKRRGDRQMDI